MLKASIPLTLVVCLRFLGLFIVLPVISLEAQKFGGEAGVSAFLLGLAVGGAYLTQIIFQTPFGVLSDRFDRKKIVVFGLLIFMVGSIVCALSDSIYMLIIGRFIQGAGAVGGVVSAQISDLVREEHRTSAMAIMGGGIFASFTLGMLLGPIVGAYLGVDWLFFITAGLSLIAILLLQFFVPPTPKIEYSFKQDLRWSSVLGDKSLAIMNLSSFLEKAFMMIVFVIVPLVFVDKMGFGENDLWKIYVPGAILGIFALAPASILAEKHAKAKLVMSYGIVFFLLSFAVLALGAESSKMWVFVIGVVLFFIGFATLEPIMQSLTSKYAKAPQRGSALGIFTTFAYIGNFAGAMVGGLAYKHLGMIGTAIVTGVICLAWLASLTLIKNPAKQKNLYLPINDYDTKMIDALQNSEGVIECYINTTEGVIVLKYDSTILDTAAAQSLADGYAK